MFKGVLLHNLLQNGLAFLKENPSAGDVNYKRLYSVSAARASVVVQI